MIRTDLIAPVGELLERQARRFPEKVAYSDATRSITYGDLDRATHNLATRLRGMGIGPGKSVALWLPNSVDWVVACLATVRAGGISVPISYEATRDEVAYRIEDASCGVAITHADRSDVLDELSVSPPVVKIVAGMQPVGDASFEESCATPAVEIELEPDDIDQPSYIVYTSGTTGRAKGVLLTTRGMLWVTAACWAPILGLDSEDRVLSPLPLFHSYALNISVLGILATGASEHILERFSTQAVSELLRSGEYTLMPGVPTMFHYMLLAARADGGKAFKGLRYCISAGAIMPGTLNRDFEAYFGIELLDGYGITETSTMVTMNWPGRYRVPGSCGLPVPGLAVRIVDLTTGVDVPFGDEGELICRGPNLMLGYHDKPVETAQAFVDGWYRTGDLARSDKSGFLTITGRLKEIIIRGGQNIAPAEVEEAFLGLNEVMDCAVVGVKHDTLGEVPFAFVVPKEGEPVDPELLLARCRERLSSYKVPAEIHLVGEIPRTGSGKIMRFKLRESVEQPIHNPSGSK